MCGYNSLRIALLNSSLGKESVRNLVTVIVIIISSIIYRGFRTVRDTSPRVSDLLGNNINKPSLSVKARHI